MPNIAEGALLGLILRDPPALSDVTDALRPEHFTVDVNRHIYQAFLALADRRLWIDIVSVADHLRSLGDCEQELVTGALVDLPDRRKKQAWPVPSDSAGLLCQLSEVHRTNCLSFARSWTMAQVSSLQYSLRSASTFALSKPPGS